MQPASPPPASPSSGEKRQTTILEKIGSFQDIEDIDLSQLLRVTAAENGARAADDEPGIVTVVTEEDIRRSGARTVQEVLETVAGFEVLVDNLGQQRIVVRGVPAGFSGGSSENVLVLLNGLRLNENIFGGATAVNLDVPVDNIKRIEIVRGPGSVLFGPGSFLGVVNIVTESTDTFRRDELSVGAGSFGAFQYNYRYGTTVGEVSLAGFMQFSRTGGTGLEVAADAQTATDRALAPLDIAAASLAPGEVVDDGKAVDANIAVAWRDLTVNARLKKEDVGGFVGLLDVLGAQNRLNNQQFTIDAHYRRAIPRGDVKVGLEYGDSRIVRFLDVFPPGFTILDGDRRILFPSGVAFQHNLNSRRIGIEAIANRTVRADHTLTAGIGLERESTFGLDARTSLDVAKRLPLAGFVSVPDLVPDAERTIFSLFAQDAWTPSDRVSVTGGLRVDAYSDFGAEIGPRLAAIWRSPRDVNVKASYGHAVRTPSFAERFYSTPGALANASLETASIDTVDAGVLVRRKDVRVSATAYLSAIRDIIGTAHTFTGRGTIPRFVNREGIDARGIDLEASRSFEGSRTVQLVYSLQSATDRHTEARLSGIPRHLARISGNLPAGEYVIVSPSLTLRSGRPRAPVDPRPDLGGYATFDVVARVHNFHPALEVQAVVRDLFGTDYFDPSPIGGLPGDYPRPGRSIFVKVKYRF